RYAAAAELREDWRLVRRGYAPRYAGKGGPLRRLAAAVRRNPWGIGVGVLAALLAALFAGVLFSRKSPSDRAEGTNGIVPRAESIPPAEPPTRIVHVTTDPPGARIALVPLDPQDGFPVPEWK